MRTRTIFAGALLLALFLVVAGCEKPAEKSGSTTSQPGGSLGAEVGRPAPDINLVDTAGRAWKLSELKGQVIFVNFWATWCPPCRREIPLLNALRAEYGPRGYEIVGIAVDFREDVLAYMKGTPISYPMLIGEQDAIDVAQAFGIDDLFYPSTVFIDRRGRIVTIKVGELHAPEANAILSALGEVDAGRLSIDDARTRIRSQLTALSRNTG
jgi:thiol-disulfide isomerase/thioredoxin